MLIPPPSMVRHCWLPSVTPPPSFSYDASSFDNLQDLQEQDFEQFEQKGK
jgi:hypothetical protein